MDKPDFGELARQLHMRLSCVFAGDGPTGDMAKVAKFLGELHQQWARNAGPTQIIEEKVKTGRSWLAI
jgi:hypothetical protein